jgi:hypothetical protein
MKTPLKLANGASTGYGLGLITDRYRGVETLSHAGGVLGGNSQMLKVPAIGLDIVVIVNRHDALGMRLANRILDACLPSLEPECPQTGAAVIGTFQSKRTRRVIQLLVQEGQQIASIDGLDVPCVRDGDLLHPTAEYSSIKYMLTVADDPPTLIRFNDFGNHDEFTALPLPRSEVVVPFGRYRSESTGTEAMVFEKDDGARLRTIGRFGFVDFRLECLADRIWRAKPTQSIFPLGGVLVFEDDGSEFRFSSSRLWSLPFRRVP